MKRIMFFAFLLFCASYMFAQTVVPNSDPSALLGLVPAKYTALVATTGTVLWLISEALSYIPAVKANGVFQLVFGWLGKLFSKPTPPPAA